MEKINEETNANHIYMRLAEGRNVYEIDVYVTDFELKYVTSADYDLHLRQQIITAFHKLY